MNPLHLPVLRWGEPYASAEQSRLHHLQSGEPLAVLSQANAGLVRRDLRRAAAARRALRAVPTAELLRICARAGELFMSATLPVGEAAGWRGQSPGDYVRQLAGTSGLPHSLIRRNMAKIHQVFAEMPLILRGLTRGLPEQVFDSGFGEQAGVPVSYFTVAEALGVVLPSNSPGVNSLWMPAIALKVPVVLKPGREEPWTPLRIIHSFIAAGCPRAAFGFYPTDHEGSAAVLDGCGRALIFGDEKTVQRYAANPGVQVHGPGRSKVLLGADEADHWERYVEVIAASIAENGGRSCINASAVVTPRHAEALGAALAERLAELRPRGAEDPDAALAGFANPRMADAIDAAIEAGLATPGAEDLTARHRKGPRHVVFQGSHYLLPTLVRCRDFSHPLANTEYLFPYASLVEVPQERMLEQIGPSLVVTAITRDPEFVEALIASPLVERLNLGPLATSRVQWDQPHEGNLFEFLYRRRAIQRAQWEA